MIVKDAKAYAVYGRRGSGKSYLVKKMLRDYSRIIVFDPMAEYGARRGWKTVHSPDELHTSIIKGWKKGFKISFVAEQNYQKELHILSSYLWEAQKSARNKILLVVEEMNMGYPPQIKADYYGFPKLIMQGRHRGVEIIGVTQRPAAVNVNFRSNCASEHFFPLSDEVDIGLVRQKVGREKLKEYRSMKPYFHMKTQNGSVEFRKA